MHTIAHAHSSFMLHAWSPELSFANDVSNVLPVLPAQLHLHNSS